MAESTRVALIAGASGLVGGHCLRALLDHPSYSRVIALVRKPLPLEYPRLTQLTVDFAQLDPGKALHGLWLAACANTAR